MKKLMIAAAAAAMVGGAFAWTATYDFGANLTTTIGQKGYVTYTAKERHLGTDAGMTKMWYNDAIFAGVDKTSGKTYMTNFKWYTAYSYAGEPYQSLMIVSADGTLTAAEDAFLETLEGTYGYKMFGNWCGDFYYTLANAGQCYRIPSASCISYQDVTLDNNCCTVGLLDYSFKRERGTVTVIDYASVNPYFMNTFGQQTKEAATLIEMFASVGNVKTTAELAFNGYIAGQGSWAEIAAQNDATYLAKVPVQITGMIVGYTEAPFCPDCCVLPLKNAVAFRCYNATPESDLYATAAYGTWYLNLNKLIK